jgi:hypothetical protein
MALVPPLSGGMTIQNFARNPVLVNNRLSAACYRTQTLASNLAKSQIALLAVEDPQVEVRQWIARHGNYLDYSRSHPEHSNNNLEDYLKNDPDPFVRACLHENPTVFNAWDRAAWLKYFQEATHMERLALMRNPEVVCAHANPDYS